MTIRTVVEADRREWARMRDGLWPGSPADRDEETRTYCEQARTEPMVCFRRSLPQEP
jgi:hypothetical protein